MNTVLKLQTLLKNTVNKTRKLLTTRLGRTRKLSPNAILSQARKAENANMKSCHHEIDSLLAQMKRLPNPNVFSYYGEMLKKCDSVTESIVTMKSKIPSEPELHSIVSQYKLVRKYVFALVKTILKDVRYSEKDAKEFGRMTREKTEHEIGLQSKTIVSLWLNNQLLMKWLSNLKSQTKTQTKSNTLLSSNKCKPHYLDHPDVNIGSKFSNMVAKLAELKFAVKKNPPNESLFRLFPKQLQSKQI